MSHPVAWAMWALTAVSLLFVALRLYTRIHIIRFVGIEDYLYIATAVLLIGFTASLQVAVHYGLGRSFWTLALEDTSNSILWTYVATTFAHAGNAMAKLCLGFFLLRVAQHRVQQVMLWVLIFGTAATTIALIIMLWNQTTPVKMAWDPLRTKGKFNIPIKPISVGIGAWSIICDFFFAIFPWLFIWSLRMSRREKMMLAGGMSLGALAGVFGIVRIVVLARLDVTDYTLNFVKYFGWEGAEIAVSMICLAIPTLRPLYLRSRSQHSYYYEQDGATPQQGESSELRQYGTSKQEEQISPAAEESRVDVRRPKTPDFFRGPAAANNAMVEMESARDIQRPELGLSRPAAAYTLDPNHQSDSDSADTILERPTEGRGGLHSGGRWTRNLSPAGGELRPSNWPLGP